MEDNIPLWLTVLALEGILAFHFQLVEDLPDMGSPVCSVLAFALMAEQGRGFVDYEWAALAVDERTQAV